MDWWDVDTADGDISTPRITWPAPVAELLSNSFFLSITDREELLKNELEEFELGE